jgi:hypothetical protein
MSIYANGYDMSIYTNRGGVNYASNDWFNSRWEYKRIAKIRKEKGIAGPTSDKFYRGLKSSFKTKHKKH